MKAVILAGGMGTRLSEETTIRPKPMVEIGGKPILWHILNIYAAHGIRDFVIALGYKSDMIKNYFLNFFAVNSDLTLDLATGGVRVHGDRHYDWKVHLVDTGLNTQTGGRLKRLQSWLKDDTFLMTYGDGVADVDIRKSIAYHRSHGKLATVTAVHPPSRFGAMEIGEDGTIQHFAEKPQAGEAWINGGFFVLEPAVLDLIEGDDTPWEQQPLISLVQQQQLKAWQHDGFWQPMDTLREMKLLDSLWQSGQAPWKVWS